MCPQRANRMTQRCVTSDRPVVRLAALQGEAGYALAAAATMVRHCGCIGTPSESCNVFRKRCAGLSHGASLLFGCPTNGDAPPFLDKRTVGAVP